MITVISGSNRKGSECLFFSKKLFSILKSKTEEEVKLLALEEIPHDWFFADMYKKGNQAASLVAIQDEYMIPAQKFLVVSPEYNGSMTGVLKLFIDACSVRKKKETFSSKKAAVVGIASGRAGNLLGLDHLVAVLNHLGVLTFPNRLPISSIHNLMGDNNIIDEKTLDVMEQQVDSLLAM